MGNFDIIGFDSSYKVPKFGGQVLFGQGVVGAASLATLVLLVGMRGASGNLVLDTEVREVFSDADVITAVGSRSQLRNMYLAGSNVPNRRFFLAAVTEPAGGTAATATATMGGTVAATPGQVTFYCGKDIIVVPISAGDSNDVVGASVSTAWAKYTGNACTYAYNAGAHLGTWTHMHKGVGGKDQAIIMDASQLPSGITITLAGSANLAGNGLTGILLGASATGTGNEDVTTLLTSAQITAKRFARIALGHNDSANATRWQTFVRTQAGATILKLEQFIMGTNGSQGTATTLAQTDLNEPRAQVVATRNYHMHPSECAALDAAVRAGVEGASQYNVPDFDGYVLPGFPAQLITGDQWSDTEQNALLNAGVTPLNTVDSQLTIVRGVTTYCLNGSQQDERCIDIGDATTADWVLLDLQLEYETNFRPQNPLVRDNAAQGEQIPPGVATPDMWETVMFRKFAGYADGTSSNGPIINGESFRVPTSPIYNPPVATFSKPDQAIQALATIYPLRVQHKLSTKVIQSADLAA